MEVPDARTQAMGSHQMEGLLVCPKNQLQQQQQQQQQERKPRPHPEQAIKCPRCASTNTKFCYYNNYSLSQPRYFCKGCRRYWTQGGSLRNVPVGGGCRKNKRPSSSSSSKKAALDHQDLITATNSFNPLLPPPFINPPVLSPSDLTLTFAGLHKQSHAPSLLLGHANSTESLLNTAVSTNNGFLDTATPSGLSNLYYGLGASTDGGVGSGEDGLLSFNEGGLGDAAAARRATSQASCKEMQDEGYQSQTKVMMGLPWQVGGDGGMAAVDAAGLRDWSTTGVNGSSWHGLISSSQLMSGARIDMPSTLGDAYAFF